MLAPHQLLNPITYLCSDSSVFLTEKADLIHHTLNFLRSISARTDAVKLNCYHHS
jgi:hypothetical protein